MKHLVHHPHADREVIETARWYERERQGLSADFLDELDAAYSRIAANPQRFGFVENDVRCCQLHRFPYGVYFIDEEHRIYVIAVLRLHRDPKAWRKRL